MRLVLLLAVFLGLAACGESIATSETQPARILVMGDSMMAWNRPVGGQVARALSARLGQGVDDRSVIGARHFYPLPATGAAGLRISAQARGGPYDWVVLNGGGNDLLFSCGCGACTNTMNQLVSEDGSTGAIPTLVAQLRASGARVIHTGYMRTKGVRSIVRGCRPLGDELERRLARMAARDPGVWFVNLANLVEVEGDTSLHSGDLVHPSVKGSARIAERVAKVIQSGR